MAKVQLNAVRFERQQRVLNWARKVLSEDEVSGREQRAIRLAEETIELAQSCNVDKAMLHRLVDFVYERPVGEPMQELGGVSVCVLAMANSLGLDADAVEEMEVQRCEQMDPERFKARNATKNAAGFIAMGDSSACSYDGEPCYVGDEDNRHYRCGTVQCGRTAKSP